MLAHQRRKVEEEMRWLDRHLWGRADTTNLALNATSPLAGLLSLNDVARVGSVYGVEVNGLLVPETVARDSFDVARFEVTRAQWKAFDPSYDVSPGTENHAVGGITFERAQAYVAWLARETGRPFRLPTKKEWDTLGGGGSGNTLDWWAGYPPSPEDTERLHTAIARLDGEAPLLRAVGSIAGDATGQPRVYDLGGNVAEWTLSEAGEGELAGGSADQPKERAKDGGAADLAYSGVRVTVPK
jgi:formylglycine-generating enzyme required for sulfatase activity